MPPKRRSAAKGKAKEDEQPAEPTEFIVPDVDMDTEAEVAAAVDQLLSSPAKEAVEEAAGAAPQSVASLSMARSRLTTLLSKVAREEVELEVVRPPRSPPSEHFIVDDVDGRESPTPNRKSDTPGSPSKKKRRRDPLETGGTHHSYVMKLFDRSVDLAQFNDKSALYPVCRAWMANKPRQAPRASLYESDDEFDFMDYASDELGKPVRKMPQPEQKTDAHCRVPHKLPQRATGEIVVKQEEDDESLLEEHKMHWRQVKQDWVKAAFANEKRFNKSITIIEDIYKRAQELYS
ncbi:protein lin-37 homolog [Neocloeon triangulifer]|uniref:protein lin-37 homolog n=1 Tax=Neocloeon triangulifer TaxID=2078957 RepID=UPI00286F030E|nr:protein lin-37 homolog [Neocloeon triangulifer]